MLVKLIAGLSLVAALALGGISWSAGSSHATEAPAVRAGDCCSEGGACCCPGSPCCSDDCCAAGAACCNPPSACCVGAKAQAKATKTCCGSGSACCDAGEDCCLGGAD